MFHRGFTHLKSHYQKLDTQTTSRGNISIQVIAIKSRLLKQPSLTEGADNNTSLFSFS
jgi:hypothetical protein